MSAMPASVTFFTMNDDEPSLHAPVAQRRRQRSTLRSPSMYIRSPRSHRTCLVHHFNSELQYREATSAGVPAMERSRAGDSGAGPADERTVAYLEGRHHPQQALAPRTAFVALDGATVVGYIAGHATTRYGCAGEVQYLYVTPNYRRRRVARQLLVSLARWFHDRGIARVCVNADPESAGAVDFYGAQGAHPLNRYWYVWDDISTLLPPAATRQHHDPAR